jgi:hypothetical protein
MTSRSTVQLIALIGLAWLALGVAACATTAVPKPTPPSAGSDESWLLGPFTNDRCFHVTLDGPNHYRFVIDGVEYPRALGSVQVGILVYAVDIGMLEPRPDRLALLRRLEFHADGDASGAFEVTLFLVDGEGQESQSFRIDQICGSA